MKQEGNLGFMVLNPRCNPSSWL